MEIWQKIKALFRPAYLYRSAETGEFVSEKFARDNPKTTYRQRILFPRGGHHR